jgi:hypothetical protein
MIGFPIIEPGALRPAGSWKGRVTNKKPGTSATRA